jgi:hypothetical protein
MASDMEKGSAEGDFGLYNASGENAMRQFFLAKA